MFLAVVINLPLKVNVKLKHIVSGNFHSQQHCALHKHCHNIINLLSGSTGIIQPSSHLDYEDPTDRYFVLNISVSDHGSPSLSSHVPVYINITDFNDNLPKFIEASLISEVKENLASGILVTTIQATDADFGNNSLVRKNIKNKYSCVKRLFVIIGQFSCFNKVIVFVNRCVIPCWSPVINFLLIQ